MSRRYSDQPINLIARIPSPEQMSAARPKQRSWIHLAMEFGATCVRGMAEVVAQLGRLGRSLPCAANDTLSAAASLGQARNQEIEPIQILASTVRVSDSRSVSSVANGDGAVPPVQSEETCSAPAPAVRPVVAVVESAPLDEVVALRSELAVYQREMIRLSAQVQDLRSLAGSQQQVLAYLGKEIEACQPSIASTAALSLPPAKKARVARAKSVTRDQSASRTRSHEPSLNL